VLLAPPAQAAAVSTTLRAGISGLPVATEVRTGYARDKFHLWIDADGDGCNTRNEVLIAEATTKPTVGASCALSGGRWLSYYDNATWTLASDLDIDHLVPLAEAWDSGARNWTAASASSTRTTSATPATSSRSPQHQPGQGRPGPGRVDAAGGQRHLPLRRRVDGREDPLAADRGQRREERADQHRRRLHQRHDHRHPGDLTPG
jgi:hypothetical protein